MATTATNSVENATTSSDILDVTIKETAFAWKVGQDRIAIKVSLLLIRVRVNLVKIPTS